MRIKIKSDPKKRGFTIPVPLWLLKFRFVTKLITKNGKLGKDLSADEVHQFIVLICKELKKHKKLVLLDVTSVDGTQVKITI